MFRGLRQGRRRGLRGRLNTILREIYRRRAVFAEALRQTIQNVEDAKFETIGQSNRQQEDCRKRRMR